MKLRPGKIPEERSRQQPAPMFSLQAASDVIKRVELPWLIQDILPRVGFTCIYGQSGVGKSFCVISMVAAIALGQHWFGFPTEQCDVICVIQEGAAGLARRLRAWSIHHKRPFPSNVKFVFEPFVLTNPRHTVELARRIQEAGGAGLIVIETLSQVAPGADENASADMGKSIAGASDLKEFIGGTVLVVHHAGKDAGRGLRGHSSLKAALDTSIFVERKDGHISWTLDKSKDSEDQVTRHFHLFKLEVGYDTAGRPISSCVVVEAEDVPIPSAGRSPKGENQRKVLAAVQEILVEQRIQAAAFKPDWPDIDSEGIGYSELLDMIKDVLDVSDKHRLSRTKETLKSLVLGEYLSFDVDRELVRLPLGIRSGRELSGS